MTSGRADKKGTRNKNIAGGSVKLTVRDKKIARAIEETLAFLFSLSESGLAESSLEGIRERDLGLGQIAKFLFEIASASDVPKALRQETRTMAETARQLGTRPPIYEVPPATRRKARQLAFRLEAATMRGTGSSTLTPGTRGRIVSLMCRKIETGMSLRKAAESLSDRIPLSPSRLEQIYRETKARLERAV